MSNGGVIFHLQQKLIGEMKMRFKDPLKKINNKTNIFTAGLDLL